MREAIGSTWLIYLVIVFLLVYIFFISFIMNYASAYRTANFIVTQIESCQGYSDCASDWDTSDNIKTISSKYRYRGPYTITCKEVDETNKVVTSIVHDVELKVEFDVPLIGTLPAFSVKAETKSMHNTKCGNPNPKTGFIN